MIKKENLIFRVFVSMCALVMLSFVGFVLFIFAGFVPANNMHLNRLERTFDTIQHPGESHLIKRMKEVSSNGGANYCLYDVGEFRTTSLSKEDMQSWYERRYPEYFGSFDVSPSISFSFPDEESCSTNTVDLCFIWMNRNELQTPSEGELMYLILFTDTTRYDKSFDYRCS